MYIILRYTPTWCYRNNYLVKVTSRDLVGLPDTKLLIADKQLIRQPDKISGKRLTLFVYPDYVAQIIMKLVWSTGSFELESLRKNWHNIMR